MRLRLHACLATLPAAVLCSTLSLAAQTPQYPTYPSETPSKVTIPADAADYTRRVVMIPMRDGVKLRTIILIPKGAKNAPILLTRTPYDAAVLTANTHSSHLGSSLYGYDNATDVIIAGGYIRVVQDVRGKYGSEGDYVMNRPFHGPLNPTPVDNSTDTYDTIDWLVKNTPESNGKVGIIGISYDGFTALAALVHPHPALKVAVPMNPMVDGWRGDDWFHNGAFREQNMSYIYEQDGTRDNSAKWWISNFDDYDMFMRAGSAGELGHERGMEQMGFWRKVIAHPSYDAFWQEQAMDKILAGQPITVPTLLVASEWDAEDIYGAMAVYRALKPKDTDNKVFLALGPWHHGGSIADGTAVGNLKFPTDTSFYFRQNVLGPFLARYLKDDTSVPQNTPPIAPVTVYESGANVWQKLPSWPIACTEAPGAAPCAKPAARLYLHAGDSVSFAPPTANEAAFDEYISDPAKPVPYRSRPSQPMGYDNGLTWPDWLTDDQREASGRTDVAVFTSDTLTAPVTIAGEPIANLIASTTGTDSDWVVKLIDVYPDEVAGDPKMGGYQLMISADIFRGRYRESLEHPAAIPAGKPELYRFALPTADHVFLPGHKIMVQVQSSWFPLYDRNPQTFVPNIFFAKPADYQKATQHIYHSASEASFIELPVVTTP
ncbi:MAG TPA: CocE/NonD family hydrolase [Granulicella sp.]|nr:CocE/NonD family hydrolase [Granulicella sp.]